MIKILQAGALALIYAWWSWILWRYGLHARWKCLWLYCLAAIPFNVALWFSLQYRELAIAMLALRMLPGIETLYWLIRRERWPAKAQLITAAALIETGMLVPAFSDVQWAYMPIRNLLLAAEAAGMLVMVLCDWRWPLDCDSRDRYHLRVLTCWMWVLTFSSMLHPWYADSMARWEVANTLYIVALALVVWRYRYVPTGSGGGFSSRSAAT